MLITKDIPCGNVRITERKDSIEVEIVAYSKAPRYTFFQIEDINGSD